jgi:hypothetical protein
MADCSEIFARFNSNISLRPFEKQYLRKARTSITTRIINNFRTKPQIPKIEFKPQGSYTMDTIIRPLNGEYDIDIGIYFAFPSNNIEDWPVPQSVSGWVVEAVKTHTSTPPENKTTCVRVTYKPVSPGSDFGYHVDLPVYGKYTDWWAEKYTVIGMNDERQWNQKSHPLAFTDWFNKQCLKNEKDKKQLIRIVKYLKAWKDFQTKDIKMPSGMILTIIAAKNFQFDDRDDIALCKTLDLIYFNLWWGFWVIKPVEPGNDLVDSSIFPSRRKKFFMQKLEELRDDAQKALDSTSNSEAISIWQKHFGDRFN